MANEQTKIDNRGNSPGTHKETRMRKIYVACTIIFIVCLGIVIYLLFLEGGKPVLPFVFTSDASKNEQYSISYEIGPVSSEEAKKSFFAVFDMQNLSFRNSIDRSICNNEECPNPGIAENIKMEFSNAIFRIYDVTKGGFQISDHYQDAEIRYGLSNIRNGQLIQEFDSTSSLEEYLQKYLVVNPAGRSFLQLSTPGDYNKVYYINLFSNYLQFYQEELRPKCRVHFNFTHRTASPYFAARHATNLHEDCPPASSAVPFQVYLGFAVGEPVILETNNIVYDLSKDVNSETAENKKYIIVLDSSEDTTVSALNNMIDLYTIGYDGSLTSNTGLTFPKASIMTDDLAGNLIYGRNEFQVPLYSKLNINNIDSLKSDINYAVYDPDKPQNNYTIQVRGSSDDAAINDESLISDKNKELENFKSLAIPVLTAILSGVLSFVLGLFVGKQDDS